jgi:hypothetical protein
VGTDNDTVTIEMSDGRPTAINTHGKRLPYVGTVVTQLDRDDYLGTYESDELGTEYWFEADTSETGLVLRHRKHDPEVLRPGFRDAFFSGGEWIVFTRAGDGRINGFTWSSGRVRKVVFVRR